jgi:exodeoxyribonuclease V gamma subunit
MLTLYHAPDLETLGELATTLLATPMRDPFAPALVVASSPRVSRSGA